MADQYKNCRDCIYGCKLMEDLISCDYFIKTSIRRPCPGGDGCTVKQTGKKVGAWEFQNNAEWEKRERNRQRRDKRRKKRMRTVVCPICGKAFQTSDTRKMYCSKECAYEAQRRKWKARYEREKQNGKQAKSAAGTV